MSDQKVKNKKREPLTREEFFDTLTKVTATVESTEKEKSETSESRPRGGYSEKHTH